MVERARGRSTKEGYCISILNIINDFRILGTGRGLRSYQAYVLSANTRISSSRFPCFRVPQERF